MSFRKALAVALPLLVAAPAAAAGYDRLYVFGDSLVDSGNAKIGAQLFAPDPANPPVVAPASEGYYQGRFSNGFNYADDLSYLARLGPATSYLQGGTNYAVGGATTATIAPGIRPDPTDDKIPSFTQQIALYQASTLGTVPGFPPSPARPAIDANSLVLVNFGGNDIRDLLQYGVPNPLDAVAALTTGLAQLVADGARNIVVVGLPDIGKLPSVIDKGPAAEMAGTSLSAGLNAAYAGVAAQANAGLGGAGSVQFFDLFALQNALEANPAAFGVDPALLSHDCVDDGAQAGGCQGYLFFDGIHPTAAIHGIVASRLAAQLGIAPAPEPATWGMLVLGFGAIGGALRARRRGRVAAA